MTTDRILVERVTDGERCGRCPCRYERGAYGMFWCLPFEEDVDDGLRCPSCLATPSAPALTAEQAEAVKGILQHVPTSVTACHGDKCREPWCRSCMGDEEAHIAVYAAQDAATALRAAFPEVFKEAPHD